MWVKGELAIVRSFPIKKNGQTELLGPIPGPGSSLLLLFDIAMQ